MTIPPQLFTAFDGYRVLAHGPLDDVILQVKQVSESSKTAEILVFSDLTGKQMDFNLKGSEAEVLERLSVYRSPEVSTTTGGPGRPRLGVVAREVSLLPRHWEWLSTQSGGASATLRRLVDAAKKTSIEVNSTREAQERTHQFLTAIAGNFPRYEAALRALYAGNGAEFKTLIEDWPMEVRDYAIRLAKF